MRFLSPRLEERQRQNHFVMVNGSGYRNGYSVRDYWFVWYYCIHQQVHIQFWRSFSLLHHFNCIVSLHSLDRPPFSAICANTCSGSVSAHGFFSCWPMSKSGIAWKRRFSLLSLWPLRFSLRWWLLNLTHLWGTVVLQSAWDTVFCRIRLGRFRCRLLEPERSRVLRTLPEGWAFSSTLLTSGQAIGGRLRRSKTDSSLCFLPFHWPIPFSGCHLGCMGHSLSCVSLKMWHVAIV